MTTIFQIIENDHNTHRRLLDDIAATQGDFEKRRRLWEQFYYDVKSHAAAEEETFYARLMRKPDGQDPARHSVSEHKDMDDIIEELEEMDISSPGWLNRFATLQHDYEHHMDEEENDIFPKGRELFSDAEVRKFAADFSERKDAERSLVDKKVEEKLED